MVKKLWEVYARCDRTKNEQMSLVAQASRQAGRQADKTVHSLSACLSEERRGRSNSPCVV